MIIYKFTITASNEAHTDTITDYIAAYGYEHARQHITKRLNNAGWHIDKIDGWQIHLEDIRDNCDHITD